MPDDLKPGFVWNDSYDTAPKSLVERLADDIIQRSIMNQFEPRIDDSAKKETRAEPDWDGNVPPDLSDGFDFLL